MSILTVEQFKQALPDKFKKTVNQELIDNINSILSDPDLYEVYRDNLLSYTSVMRDGKFKMLDYIHAVKYCSHKIMGSSNTDAYIKTFPNKYQGFLNNGVSQKDIASYITAYNKTKLVNLILEQSLIPSWVLNQDLYQKAINVQAELMMTAQSEKVRSDAANSLLNHLRPPEVQKVELDIGVKGNNSIEALRNTTMELVAMQKKMIEAGVMTVQEVAEHRVVAVIEENSNESQNSN